MTEYIKVEPTRENIQPTEVASHIQSLHKLDRRSTDEDSGGWTSAIGSMGNGGGYPTIEFLMATGGKNTQIEFFYRGEVNLDVLRERLITAYPSSFDVDRVDIDLRKKMISPEEYEPSEYVERFEEGGLVHEENETGTEEELTKKHLVEQETNLSSEDIFINQEVDEEEVEGRPELKSASDIEVVQPVTTKKAGAPAAEIPGPAWTEDNTVLARPNPDQGTPIGVEWYGRGDKKNDWMTKFPNFTGRMEANGEDEERKATLSNLIQHFTKVDHPVVFQVVFKKKPDFSAAAEKRKKELHLNTDTWMGKISHNLSLMGASGNEHREMMRDRKRDYFDEAGESSHGGDSSLYGQVGKRAEHMDEKQAGKCFQGSARALAIATEDQDIQNVRQNMKKISSGLDDIEGYFYHLESELKEDGGGLRNREAGSLVRSKMVNRSVGEVGDKRSTGLVLNGDELTNFVAVPSAGGLTAEGSRGTRAEARSRNPLPRPHPDLMQKFHVPGMRTGFALDEEADQEPVPTRVPPDLLTKHYARFATTGAGKSKALINDVLSLYENTEGPTILIDPKGDGMTENYMRSHYERFGQQDWKDNVIHFNVPDILPGFGFFDITPALENGARRIDAVQRKADHYEELLKLVMGRDRYRQSKVAPTIIKALIKALFDKKHGKQREGRESSDKFPHRDLERAVKDMQLMGNTDGEEGSIPNVRDERIKDVLTRHMTSDSSDFNAIMDAVYNRIDYIREDAYLSRIFNNTEKKFDFRDHIDDDKVILFDLGELRDEPTRIITGLILTNLWDALQDSDQQKCTAGHDSIEECREHAQGDRHLPCHEDWDDDHVVNLIIDEAASVAVTGLMSKMLEQGRSFKLGMGLSMQFPEQMKDTDERMYRNILNNIGTLLIGKITLDDEIADAIAHEDVDAEDFGNRIKALPRGEWIIQLPSPEFQSTGPEPFSLSPLPIPSGHPESRTPLDESAEETFTHYLDNVIHQRIEEDYGISFSEYMKEDGESVESEIESESQQENAGGRSEAADAGSQGGGDTKESPATGSKEVSPMNNVTDDTNPEDGSETKNGWITASVDRGDTEIEETVERSSRGNGKETESDSPENRKSKKGIEDSAGSANQADGEQQGVSYQQAEADENSEEPDPESANTAHDSSAEHVEARGDGGTEATTADAGNSDIKNSKDVAGSLEPDSDSQIENVGAEDPRSDSCGVSSGAEIQTNQDISRVIERWDHDTILSVASSLMNAFKEGEGELGVLKQCLSKLSEAARSEGVTHENGTTIDTADLMAAGETAEPAPIDVDVESLAAERVEEKRDEQTPAKPPDEDSNRGGESKPDTDQEEGSVSSENHKSSTKSTDIEWQHCGLSEEEIQKSGHTDDELNFLTTVVKAMNGNLKGYDLTQSMNVIENLYNVDVEKLEREGLLKIHPMNNRRVYYTATTAGQEACNHTKREGPGVGDRGGNTPHRVGCELAVRYLEEQSDVQKIKSFVSVQQSSSKKVDVVGLDAEGTMTYVVEVESGQTASETGGSENIVGINNYASIEKDYEELSSADDATALWVIRNGQMAARVLQILNNADKTEIVNPGRVNKEARVRFNADRIEPNGGEGMDKLLTFGDVRREIGE